MSHVQAGQLDFVSDQQWVQYGKDRKTGHRTELTALQTDEARKTTVVKPE